MILKIIMKKEVSLKFLEDQITTEQELHGNINISYSGRYDSIVINAQIENSSDVFFYPYLNDKKINYPYSRLAIFKKDIGDLRDIKFVALTKHKPINFSNVKFRVSLIQEHKEIFSDVCYVKVIKMEQ